MLGKGETWRYICLSLCQPISLVQTLSTSIKQTTSLLKNTFCRVRNLLLLVVPLVLHPDRVDHGHGCLQDDHARQEGKVHVQVPVELLHPRFVVRDAV